MGESVIGILKIVEEFKKYVDVDVLIIVLVFYFMKEEMKFFFRVLGIFVGDELFEVFLEEFGGMVGFLEGG